MGKPKTYNTPVDPAYMFLSPAAPAKTNPVKPDKPTAIIGVALDPVNATALANMKPPASPDPVGFAAKMSSFKEDANAAQQSLSSRYTDGYYNAYHGDAADYATHFKDTKGKLGAKANSLLGDIEKLRGIYGSDWADDALRSVNSAMAKVNGYSDKVKNDADFWNQFENEADYGAAMFNSSAETGDEFRQMVEAKNAKSTTQQPAQPMPMDPTSYAIAMSAKNNMVQAAEEPHKQAEAMLAQQIQNPTGYAITMRAIDQQAINEAKQNAAPASYAPGMDSVKFGAIINQFQTEINQLEQSLPTLSLDEYNKASAQIAQLKKQQAKLVEDNADVYIQQNMDRMKTLAQKDTLTPSEKHEAMLGAAALRGAAKSMYGFGSTYDPVTAGISNGYNGLAGILENKYNGMKGLGLGALASVPNVASGYDAYLNNGAFQELTSQNMSDPEIAGIVNQYNPFEDLRKNRPGVYYAGLTGGSLLQGTASKAAGKALGLTGEAVGIPVNMTGGSLADELALAANKGKDFYNRLIQYWKSVIKPEAKTASNAADDIAHAAIPEINTGLESTVPKAYTEGAGDVFKSTPELENHIQYVDSSVPRSRGIGGAHNSEEFFKNDVQIVKEIPSPEIPGVTYYQYNMTKLGKDGWPVGEYGTRIFEKTVYDPRVFSESEYMQRGLEAASDSYKRNGFLGATWEGVDSQGVKWIGYGKNGVPTSFFPDVPKP